MALRRRHEPDGWPFSQRSEKPNAVRHAVRCSAVSAAAHGERHPSELGQWARDARNGRTPPDSWRRRECPCRLAAGCGSCPRAAEELDPHQRQRPRQRR
ncbi:hypothetical protein TBHG_04070 [Mycobacterium tuberculosis str. Haarlem]|nr:hypothetical protein TBHG_04070 [Mycobacterium tuberculosis str. Haarlem]CCG12360.1 hypothetical protein MT7199_2512 [Mycobacterium tuberculosis 7199-99]